MLPPTHSRHCNITQQTRLQNNRLRCSCARIARSAGPGPWRVTRGLTPQDITPPSYNIKSANPKHSPMANAPACSHTFGTPGSWDQNFRMRTHAPKGLLIQKWFEGDFNFKVDHSDASQRGQVQMAGASEPINPTTWSASWSMSLQCEHPASGCRPQFPICLEYQQQHHGAQSWCKRSAQSN